jgi:hypothetical protein
MEHALIVGGTGMISGVSKWLIKTVKYVSVVGRNKQRLQRLHPGDDKTGFQPVSLDYKDTEDLRKFLRQSIQKNGPVDIVVSWIHSDAPDAIPAIFEEINHCQQEQWRFVHIKGSSRDLPAIQSQITVPINCLYRDVQLGFKMEGDVSRWLTHEEISKGIISAIQHDRKKTIVGTLSPWEKRP